MKSTRCRKRRYIDKVSADLSLAEIRTKDNPRRKEQEERSYRCSECKYWHLTSQKLKGD